MNELDNLDFFEVEPKDYDSYFFRLPKNEIMKTTPREGLTIYKDTTNGINICGILTEQIMAMPANRYFIFNLLPEERLGPHKAYQHIELSEEEYLDLLKKLVEAKEKKNNDA